ncbi:MAG: aminotransferase class I/II-fold pyridoxal phosphate-dependent enzyme [Acidobacteria bacterium]|nr:aminotransferase class I/II-fold pyridoxal phosphate-dependent enzyme [Acidobacteriota bacterium]
MTAQIGITGDTAAAIAASVEQRLHAGRLAPGEALPTVRELASALRVSPATVAAAYRLLQARGLVAGQGRRGTRVVSGPAAAPLAAASVVPPGTVDLASGNPDPALLPPWEPALRAIAAEPGRYGDAPQLAALTAFAAEEFEADGIPVRAPTVLSGALDAIERIVREHLRPGDRVAVEDPCFPGVADLVKASGLVAVPCTLDDEGPTPDGIDRALQSPCRALVLTPRAQNPIGAAITASRASELRRVLRRVPDVLLIENDCAGPIAGAPAVTLRDASRRRWAVVRSTSKCLGPDLRLAIVAADDLTTARVERRLALGMRWVSHILQRLTLALWADPAGGRRLARAAAVYAQRRTALLTALAARGVQAHGRSGLNVWVPVRGEAQVVRGLADRGWAVAAGERFRIQAAPGIRVTTAALMPSDAERFAGDLAAVLGSARVGLAG